MPQATSPGVPGSYLELVKVFPLLSIRTDAELDAATAFLNQLLQRNLDAGGEQYRDALTDLIELYEEAAHHVPDAPEADVLRVLMESNGLSQSELSRKSGIAQSTLSAVLNGSRSLTREHVVTLARYFGIAPAAFLPAR